MKSIEECFLYGIVDTGYVAADNFLGATRSVVEGGIDVVQLRAKGCSPDEVRKLGAAMLPITRDGGVPLIINDHPEIAGEIGADGTHVGQDDGTVESARERSGGLSLVGKSTHSVAQARAAVGEGADYIGFGPLFATPTKPDYKPIGVDDIAEVHRDVALPIFCIGGIKKDNLSGVLGAGAHRAVIVSGILQAADIAEYVRQSKEILVKGRDSR